MAIVIPASNSKADIQAAIDDAGTIDGDIIQIQPGSVTWSGATLTVDKAITIDGGGTYAVDANRNDTGSWPYQVNLSGMTDAAISITATTGSPLRVRITGIRFTGDLPGSGGGSGDGAIDAAADSISWRVDNCYFGLGNSNAFRVDNAGTQSLIDNCYFYSASGTSYENSMWLSDRRNGATYPYGDWSWSQPVGWGGTTFLFIEDCTWYFVTQSSGSTPAMLDCQAGGKFVLRNNYIRNRFVIWHGSESGDPERGGYAREIYNNTFYWADDFNRYFCCMFDRGGTTRFHNNTIENYGAEFVTWVRRSTTSYSPRFGMADGTEVHDGNWGTPYPTGYPALDQCGFGMAAGPTLATVQPQDQDPSYIYNNTLINTGAYYSNTPLYVVLGRDFYYSTDSSAAPAGYTTYTYPHPWRGDSIPEIPEISNIIIMGY
ncbi:MAG: hypothetical protein ACYTBZ_28610 [Planctomycetota bacterium]